MLIILPSSDNAQIYPWMFEDYSELRRVQDPANRVAADADWPALFDETQLAKNEVPVYAAAYEEVSVLHGRHDGIAH